MSEMGSMVTQRSTTAVLHFPGNSFNVCISPLYNCVHRPTYILLWINNQHVKLEAPRLNRIIYHIV